jgi:PIN domain nuclease of toxin-antitoxin system
VTVVLGASAILAWLQEEPGADVVDPLLTDGVVSAVNWSEVLQKTGQCGGDAGETAELLLALGVSVVDSTQSDAERAALLWERGDVLSLADRFCLVLGARLSTSVVTAENAWTDRDYGAEVQVIR